MQTPRCETIRINGLVQGVGFRPTVWKIATHLELRGEVFNDGKGVCIIALGDSQSIDQLTDKIQSECPPLAHIEQLERHSCQDNKDYDTFTISYSQNTEIQTGIVPDAVTCPECLQDITDPQNRRYQYAFTNCTHCGPRLSIIRDIPYDRSHTSMQAFELCESCEQEYNDPASRRFHAQPNACPDCGPQLTLADSNGKKVECDNPLQQCANLIQQGNIVAIKGIGGYQLACNSGSTHVVNKLRERKRRPHKALALMARDIEQVQEYCETSNQAKELMQFHAGPIVICPRIKVNDGLSHQLAPGQNCLGFMLPNTPLHHLLMQHMDKPIVLTSGNIAEQPQISDNEQAQQQLANVADYLMYHDRAIVNRIDDSVLRIIHGQPAFYRRARGYAPSPISLPPGLQNPGLQNKEQILACGAELKNTFALVKHQQVTLSQHMGNLENSATYDDYLKNIQLYHRMYQFEADCVVVDKHPEYLSTKYGKQLAQEQNIPLIEVQHHHAHIAACLAENQWPVDSGKVIGIALDGLGYGDDDDLWGGEFMLADYTGYQRLARFKPTPMPGASQCMREPWRNTLAHLFTHCDWLDVSQRYHQLELFQYLHKKPTDTLISMISNEINSPLSSSCGRLFDAVAAAAGICADRVSYEGHAAIELEAQVDHDHLSDYGHYPFELDQKDILEVNHAPMWQALLQDLAIKAPVKKIATRFHLYLTEIICSIVKQMSNDHGVSTVSLSGGVFQNPSLTTLVIERLQQQNIKVLTHQLVPANDGGISLGQAAIAAATLNET